MAFVGHVKVVADKVGSAKPVQECVSQLSFAKAAWTLQHQCLAFVLDRLIMSAVRWKRWMSNLQVVFKGYVVRTVCLMQLRGVSTRCRWFVGYRQAGS